MYVGRSLFVLLYVFVSSLFLYVLFRSFFLSVIIYVFHTITK